MAQRGPIETKVTAAAGVSLIAAVGVAVLNAVVANSTLLGPLPPVVQILILAAVPPIVVFLGGYAAPHTNRNIDAEEGVATPPPDRPY